MTDQKCLKCGYEWKPKVAEPKMCPRCHAYLKPQEKRVYVDSAESPAGEKPSENMSFQATSLIYCPFCGAKLPTSESLTEPEPLPPVEHTIVVEPEPEKEDFEESSEEEEEEEKEEPETLNAYPERSPADKTETLLSLSPKLSEALYDFLDCALNPHLTSYEMEEDRLKHVQEAYDLIEREKGRWVNFNVEKPETFSFIHQAHVKALNILYSVEPSFKKKDRGARSLWLKVQKAANALAKQLEKESP